jgi:hypothetical protein
MPCWKWIQEDKRFHQRSWRGSCRGSDAVLVMPGPSLKEAAELINQASRAGAVVIGANTSFPMVRPDVWIGCDHPECYDAALMSQPFPKFLGNAYAEKPWQGRAIKEFPQTYFLDRDKRATAEKADLFTNALVPLRLGDQPSFVWGWTFFTAIHLAAWLGCRRIYLVGVDLQVKTVAGSQEAVAGSLEPEDVLAPLQGGGFIERAAADGAANYADGRVLESRLAQINRTGMSIILEWLPALRDMGRKHGYELIVTGEASAARQYLPYVPLEEALRRIARRAASEPMIPPPADGRVHGLLANQAQWGTAKRNPEPGTRNPEPGTRNPEPGTRNPEFGVVTGSDAKTEWRLPWWHENLRRHYAGSVAFADFGMSPAAVAWCKQRGNVLDCRGTYLPGWFNKPVALMRVPWRRAAWIDTDAEVMGDLDELAKIDLGEVGYAMAPDGFNPADVGRNPVNTGVVVYQHGCQAIKTWARAALTDPSTTRGDQELLNRLIDDNQVPPPAELPAVYNRLRLAEWDGSERIIHWTGPTGDSWIRRLTFAARGRAGILLDLLPGDRPLAAAEIGVLDGRTSRLLLQRRPLLHLTMVDLWGPIANDDGGLDAPVTDARADGLMAEALKGTAFAADRRTIIRGDSAEAADGVADGTLDLVFIDADHSEAGCYRDILAWAPKVRPGGILAGHDIDHEEFPHWGVRAAVERWMGENEYDLAALTAGKDHTWYLRTRGEPRSRRDESGAEEPAAMVAAG